MLEIFSWAVERPLSPIIPDEISWAKRKRKYMPFSGKWSVLNTDEETGTNLDDYNSSMNHYTPTRHPTIRKRNNVSGNELFGLGQINPYCITVHNFSSSNDLNPEPI
jgi:hypothetical protein